MASSHILILALGLFMPSVAARRTQTDTASLKREEEEWWWTPFQDDLGSVKDAALAPKRFTGCEHIGVVLEGDANRPDMREEALLWVDFLLDQGYCVAYFFDWARHASHAWTNKDVTMNFGLGWKDALREVEQSDDGQVVQIMNSTKENWKTFTGGFETICKTESCALKRVVFAFEDHGEYRLLGLPEHKKLMREDLLGGLRSLYRAGPDVKLLAYVSACKSGSMFGGPQYSAKELLQAHYIDCELRDDGCVAGALSAGGQTVVIAGHSVVGIRQRALLRATEGLLEAQAMCDLATGDGPNSGIFARLPPEKLQELTRTLVNVSLAGNPEEAAEARQLLFSLEGFLKDRPKTDKADSSWQLKVDEAMAELGKLTRTFELWKELIVTLKKYKGVTIPEALQEVIDYRAKAGLEDPEDAEAPQRPFNVSEALIAISTLEPGFTMTDAISDLEADPREGEFMQIFNQMTLQAWVGIRVAVDGWKASVEGKELWDKLSNGGASEQVAKQSSTMMAWGVGCGTLVECLATFGRVQVLSKLHHEELGCTSRALGERMNAHFFAMGQAGGEGIEENSGLDNSATEHMVKNLLRAIAYVSEDALAPWDGESFVGKPATGDFAYADDPMLGAATEDGDPLDLMVNLDGESTRPESILAFSASVPQIISSSLLPFTVGSIGDLEERVSEKGKGKDVDTSFRAHVRAVEDLAINQDSMTTDMAFGMMSFFMKMMLKAKGSEDATLSITRKDAAARAEEFERLVNDKSTWFKRSKARKAAFYKAISEGKLPDTFLSFSYVSPATGRNITRYFDTMLSAENFGSPIAFGNMLDTDVREFFHHVPSGLERFGKHLVNVGDQILNASKNGIDWLTQVAEPKGQIGDEQTRCCCKGPSPDLCELLAGDELKKSWNPSRWGEAVCPGDLGYRHYTRFNANPSLPMSLPSQCQAAR